MPEETVNVGGRSYTVHCRDGEERFLQTAAGLLEDASRQVAEAAGDVAESRLLLMSGLMLADKTAEIVERLRAAESEIAELRRSADTAEPALPEGLRDGLEDLALRSERVADAVEARAGQGTDAAAEPL